MQLEDSALGCLVAGAIGDMIGGATERKSLSLSDDTQLTLATCEALVDTNAVSPEAIASKYLDWYKKGRLSGLGSATLKAMRDLEAGAHWAMSGARGEYAAGNGAAMRAAPLAFALDLRASPSRVILRDVCRITHHHEEAYVGALAVCLALRAEGLSPCPSTIAPIAESLPDSRVRDRFIELAQLPALPSLADMASRYGSTGYVVDTVPLAVLAALRMLNSPMESVINELLVAGGDTDTIASIACQIAGAHLGYSAIAGELVRLLEHTDVVQRSGEFAQWVGGRV